MHALVAQLAERTAVNRKVLGSNPSRSVDGLRSCRPGDVAQVVERSLSMREALGSIPSFSTLGAGGLMVRIHPFQG